MALSSAAAETRAEDNCVRTSPGQLHCCPGERHCHTRPRLIKDFPINRIEFVLSATGWDRWLGTLGMRRRGGRLPATKVAEKRWLWVNGLGVFTIIICGNMGTPIVSRSCRKWKRVRAALVWLPWLRGLVAIRQFDKNHGLAHRRR